MKQPAFPDSIQLGHGSGGLMTRELLDQIVFSTFSNPFLDRKHDGSVLPIDGPLAISTDISDPATRDPGADGRGSRTGERPMSRLVISRSWIPRR